MVDSETSIRPPLVLVANDQEWSARSLESILAPEGYEVLRAFTGQTAPHLAHIIIGALVVDCAPIHFKSEAGIYRLVDYLPQADGQFGKLLIESVLTLLIGGHAKRHAVPMLWRGYSKILPSLRPRNDSCDGGGGGFHASLFVVGVPPNL